MGWLAGWQTGSLNVWGMDGAFWQPRLTRTPCDFSLSPTLLQTSSSDEMPLPRANCLGAAAFGRQGGAIEGRHHAGIFPSSAVSLLPLLAGDLALLPQVCL